MDRSRVRILSGVVVAAFVAAACGAGATPSPTSPGVSPAASLPAFTTIEKGILTVATSDGDPPWNMRDSSGNPTGHDIEIVGEMAKRLGLTMKVNFMEWTAAPQAVAAGRADVVAGGMGWTEQRAQAMALTDPIGYQRLDLTYLKDKYNFTALEDFKDGTKTLGSIQGWSFVGYLQGVSWIGNKLKLYPSPDDAIKDLLVGRVDAITISQAGALYFIKTRPDLYSGVKVVAIPPTSGGLTVDQTEVKTVLGCPPGNTALRDALNILAKQMRADGALQKIYESYGMWDANKPR